MTPRQPSTTTRYWAGTWQSDRGTRIQGNIYAKITTLDHADFIPGTPETARVLITYTGTYMNGLRRVFDFTVTENKSSLDAPMYQFKGSGIASQNISMEATTKSDQEIKGTYTTVNPGDHGAFHLDRTSSVAIRTITFTNHTPISAAMSRCILC